jgi:hypothetical protein
MDVKEHAQQIHAHLIAAWIASGRHLTNPNEMGLHETAIINAKAFEKKWEQQADK